IPHPLSSSACNLLVQKSLPYFSCSDRVLEHQKHMDLLLLKNLRDIQRRPLRTVLTVVGVLLGVAGVVAISFTGRNLAAAQRQTYAGTRQPDLTAFVSNLSPTLVGLLE